VFAELAAHAAENGGSVYELLRSLHVRYGAHATRQHYFVARSSAAMASVFARLRRDAPVACGPFRGTATRTPQWSLIPTVNGNTVRSFSTHGHQSAAKGSSTTVSRSDIRLI
jgi:hypothetical protein